MSVKMELPAVHLSLDNFEEIEEILRENTTNYKIEILLSLPGGVEQKFHSVGQIDTTVLADIGSSNSYSVSVTGEEGRCTIAGESTGTESHILYCVGDSGWCDNIQNRLQIYFHSVQTTKSYLRGRLTGIWAAGVAILAALFVGWAVNAVAPQSVVHYFPTLLDGIVFHLGIFGLLVVRFRNWIHPYTRIGLDHSHPTVRRFIILWLISVILTIAVLIIRWWLESGPFLR